MYAILDGRTLYVYYTRRYMSSLRHILPKHTRLLQRLGEDIRLARLRRKFSAELVAERAGISRMTLYHIERGSPVVAIGAYLQVLFVLGLEQGLGELASDDVFGKKLQDLEIHTGKRAPRRKTSE